MAAKFFESKEQTQIVKCNEFSQRVDHLQEEIDACLAEMKEKIIAGAETKVLDNRLAHLQRSEEIAKQRYLVSSPVCSTMQWYF